MDRGLAAVVGSGLLAAVLLAATVAAFLGGAGAAVPAAPAATPDHTPIPSAAATFLPLSAAAERGRSLYLAKGCNGCHTVSGLPGTFSVGPDLTGLPARAATRKPGMSADDYVRESIASPQAFIVPGFEVMMPQLGLRPDEVDAVVTFLLSPR
ncbi:MAG: cytochrome c [Chloroflexota bacterium]|nr:cytochrome c [Chloroflexota bacterium]